MVNCWWKVSKLNWLVYELKDWYKSSSQFYSDLMRRVWYSNNSSACSVCLSNEVHFIVGVHVVTYLTYSESLARTLHVSKCNSYITKFVDLCHVTTHHSSKGIWSDKTTKWQFYADRSYQEKWEKKTKHFMKGFYLEPAMLLLISQPWDPTLLPLETLSTTR